jgi:UDP-GlcNAc:undecaprenyl-phosphate GlcNAc-1-phosphate transferase
MVLLALLLIPVALLLSLALTAVVRGVSDRLGAHDSSGVAGQQKVRRRVPNTGGIAIVSSVVLPLLAGLGAVHVLHDASLASIASAVGVAPDRLLVHIPGIRAQTPLALQLLAGVLVLHVLGLIDDRKPLGPFLKLVVMALPAIWIAATSDTRLLTLLDAHVGGPWLSIALTVLWFLVVTNAMNFMDNMDGLSAGVGAIGASCLLAVALMHGQWFIGACLSLLVGALAGFLVFNFPWRLKPDGSGGASIFMGDGGSVVLGFLLAFLTTRMTYISRDSLVPQPFALPEGLGNRMLVEGVSHSPPWYSVLVPLLILAVPLYDFVSVVILRLSQGRSPFVGDQQHLSHRTVRRGVNKRTAVLVLYAFAAATGLSAIPLPTLEPWQALLVGAQAFVLLAGLGLFEWSALRRDAEDTGLASKGRP